ncbi:MAG: CBS domain-containing protein [Halobacteriovoraceae bacterium]|jgi:CBS domain-containing protein|nr:CBS domain-containing protein [Halobacteriovoraceae bacterium]
MKVSEFMVSNVMSCHLDGSVKDAAKLMHDNDFSVIPIVDRENYLQGIITTADFIGQNVNIPDALADIKKILGELHYFGNIEAIYKRVEDKKLKDVMIKRPFTVTPNESLTYVIRMMQVKKIKRIPVVESNKLVGMVTRDDLIKAFIKSKSN